MKELIDLINNSSNIVFFGGAGTSTESDIPDFRSEDGLYSSEFANYKPEDILSNNFFNSNTHEFFDYIKKYVLYPNALPNKAHHSLKKLEDMGKLKGIITQNIDGLHQSAGSKNVVELHGSLHRNYCVNCGETYSMKYVLSYNAMIPLCKSCGGIVRPDVVLYGECLERYNLKRADELIANADLLIIGGTSLMVYPAAGYAKKFKGGKLVLINKTATRYDELASLIIREPIGSVLDKAINFINI